MISRLLLVLLAFSLACTNGKEEDSLADLEVPDVEEEVQDEQDSDLVEPESAQGYDADDISPSPDLLAEEEAGANEGAPSEGTPPPPSVSEDSPAVRVVGLDFKAKEAGGTIVIRTTGPASYTTRNNEGNQQFVVEIANADLPARFKRPYNTKEFEGPIAGIQAYQKPGARTARFVLQLKESIDPFVQQQGNVLKISATGALMGENSSGMAEGFTVTSSDKGVDGRILTNKNLDDFLYGNSKFYGRKISLQVKGADIRDVFNFIAEESGLNIILADEVTGKISLKLRKIPWDQALVVIMKSKQLGYVRAGNILRIAKLTDLQREADAARTVIDSQNKLKPIRVRVFPVSYAKVTDLEVQAKDFLSERGKVKADVRTNSLIVNDVDDNIERIAKLITILDTQTPQVLIEAKVVEARQSFTKRIGINWSFSGDPIELGTNGKGVPMNLQVGGSIIPGGVGATATDFNLNLGTLDFVGDLTATLSLFEFDNLIKVISSPRIMTLNGQKATIEQKTDIPVAQTTPGTGGAPPQTTFSFRPVSLLLEVQPQITADGGIIMIVQVKREFLGAQFANGGTPINSRVANTTVLINNGQTVIMGGIFQSDATEQETGVPFLRRVPIIGSLFKEALQSKEKIELIIFLTPRIMNKERAFRQAKGSSS